MFFYIIAQGSSNYGSQAFFTINESGHEKHAKLTLVIQEFEMKNTK